MCGIAGAAGTPATADRKTVEGQLRCLDHRGPDSWGVHVGTGAVIGQTRLAVIDVLGGDPPITNEDGRVGVALNGEIYNYQELGEDLRRDGHKLATDCDTEVIAHLAEDLRPLDLARRLEGMFAFAIWDDRHRRLVLGRDRLGKKPLYYHHRNGRLVFGSEIKAVLAHPDVSRELDADAIPAYLTFGYVPTPRTFFAGIHSVPPGHVLTFEPDGAGEAGQPRLERYWSPPVPGAGGPERVDLPPEEAAAEVLALLEAAVRRRLIADVPLGAFLSGGIDSSAVVALMARAGDRPVRTFTIGFEDDEGFDERPYARTVAQRFGTEHVEFVVNPNAIDLVERLVWHHDQPFGDSSAVPTFLLSELTRAHVTVSLAGDGGDELFAGYDRFAGALVLDRFQRLPVMARRSLSGAAARLPPGPVGRLTTRARRFMARSDEAVQEAFLAWVSYVPQPWVEALAGARSEWALAAWQGIWDESAGGDLLARLRHLTLRSYLLDDLLPKMDRMSMAHGLEVRSPFLDRALLEFAMRLPPAALVRRMTGKRVLRLALGGVLPEEILNRRKRGFAVPLDRWFRSDLRPYLDATVGAPSARLRAHVDSQAVDRLLAEHQSGRANHRDTLWTLLTLEIFLRREGW